MDRAAATSHQSDESAMTQKGWEVSTLAMTLYDTHVSGHCHRVRLFLSLLQATWDTVEIDMQQNEHKAPDYLSISPLGQVPTLVDGDVVITDSCAALVYLAKKYGDERWLPEDPAGAARVQRWLSTASGELYRGPVLARAIRLFGRDFDHDAALMWSDRLLKWMDRELSGRQWLAADHETIADIAMYSYLRVANEGDVDVSPFTGVTHWMADVEGLEGFIPMTRSID
jgi:glutathione S-transferase